MHVCEIGSRTMQPNGTSNGRAVVPQNLLARCEVPLLGRFLGKFALDILPAALASVIGGFLFTQYQFGHAVPRAATAQVTPASAEMMAMVRDEHAMMIDYLKSQMAADKSRAAAEDAASARAAADADAAEAEAGAASSAPAAPTRPVATTLVASRAALARGKKPVAIAAVPHAPLVIAQADQNGNENDGTGPDDRLAPGPD